MKSVVWLLTYMFTFLDALYYVSSVYKPKTLIDAATLTGAMAIALGDVYSGVFTNSDTLWESLHAAGVTTHDQFWRMPLEEAYAHQIKGSNADLCNTGGRPAGSCTAALFLKVDRTALFPPFYETNTYVFIVLCGRR